MRMQCLHTYDNIISLENLLAAWSEFRIGKRKRTDVQVFERNLMSNLITLHNDLKNKTYRHGPYHAFRIADPKPRDIHKASVRDRVLHHAIYQILYPFFDTIFVHTSYSCRNNKGTHRAIERFKQLSQHVSKNNSKTCWVLKCDIRKFFASIDQHILIGILSTYIRDKDILFLLQNIIGSFYSTQKGKGLPLGNLTSQLLVNIYMHEFDYYAKHYLKGKQYIRYADDFVIFSQNKDLLVRLIPEIQRALTNLLHLELHPKKVSIATLASGVDFLGWVHFPDHRVLRTKPKQRMQRRIAENSKPEVLQSYLGLLSHGNGRKLQEEILRASSTLGVFAVNTKRFPGA
ncbi:MAG: reverse transcriptase/maturase family protein [bacterium]|nr:reverse transcriptase/maturase family protein [bacterium]